MPVPPLAAVGGAKLIELSAVGCRPAVEIRDGVLVGTTLLCESLKLARGVGVELRPRLPARRDQRVRCSPVAAGELTS